MWELKGMGLVDRRGVGIEGHGPLDRRGVGIEGHGPGGSERCGN